jgi:dipeptidyl aminopeptidase/acylaminoacyl peptidase
VTRRIPFLLASLVLLLGASVSSLAGESAENLFANTGVSSVKISPDGRWIVARGSSGLRAGILVQRVGSANVEGVLATKGHVEAVSWVDQNTIIAELYSSFGRRFMAVRFEFTNGRVTQEESFIDAPGWLVDPRPLEPGEVIWAFNFKGRASLHRVRLAELEHFGEKKSSAGRIVLPGERLADVAGWADIWVVGPDGDARVVRRFSDDEDEDGESDGYTILFREEGARRFREVDRYGAFDAANEIIPVAVSSDGKSMVVIAYNGANTLGVHLFRPDTGEFGETLFVRPGVDVKHVQLDPIWRRVFAAVYEVDGEERYHFLSDVGDRLLSGLGPAFEKETLRLVAISADLRLFAFRVSSSTNPGAFYVRDVARGETTLIAQEGSNIDRAALSPVTTFVVESADGTSVEAFLTLPRSKRGEPAPLIVMPHGGPAGVRDTRSYDPFVQYFASWGFSVVQVNYRGSAGYGLDFSNSGKKQWATGIEDDIDAAVDHVTALPEVDGARICIVGASYGGFSALASVIRHKDRYSCAISWNGVTDIPLLYDSSDIADSKHSLEFYQEFVGDLEIDRESLLKASPAYHADQVETPVLFVFGSEDRRVDPDHSHRMMLMLDLYGKEFESLEVEGMAHGPSRREGIIIARAMRRFVSKYLEPTQTFQRDRISEMEESIDMIDPPKVDF